VQMEPRLKAESWQLAPMDPNSALTLLVFTATEPH